MRELAVANFPAKERDPHNWLETAAILAEHEAVRLDQPLLHRLTVSYDRVREATDHNQQEYVDKEQSADLDE